MSDRNSQDQPNELPDIRINRPRTRFETKQDQEVQENKENIEQSFSQEQPTDIHLLNRSERVERNSSPEYQSDHTEKKRLTSGRYCRPCQVPLRSEAAYIRHQRTMHLNPNSEGQYCDICAKSFKFKHYHTSQSDELTCFICQKELKQLKALRYHLRYTHNTTWIFLPASNDDKKLPPPPDKAPDINDPNLYCSACDYTFDERPRFHRHLRDIHGIFKSATSAGLLAQLPPLQIIIPNINDPNYHCSACDLAFPSKENFRGHLVKIHAMVEGAEKKEATINQRKKSSKGLTPEINIETLYCNICEHTYSSITSYRMHLLKIHNVAIANNGLRRHVSDNDILPNINDSNAYCQICDKSYSNILSYSAHLNLIHFIKRDSSGSGTTNATTSTTATTTSSTTKNVSKIDVNCRQCITQFRQGNELSQHIGRSAKKITSVRAAKKQSQKKRITSVEYDPNGYCGACNRKYDTIQKYRRHMKRCHDMDLPPLPTKKNVPEMLTTSNGESQSPLEKMVDDGNKYDPNGYCGTCKQTYNAVEKYRLHMKGCHHMNLPPPPNKKDAPEMLKTRDVESQSSLKKMVDNENEVVDEEVKVVDEEVKVVDEEVKVVNEEVKVVNEEEKVVNEEEVLTQQLQMKNENQEPINVDWQPTEEENLVWQPSEEVKDVEQEETVDPQPMEILNNQAHEPRHSVENKRSHCIVCQKSFTRQSSYRMHLMIVHRLSWNEFKIVRKKQPSSKRKLTENDSHNTPDLPNPPKRMKVNQKRTFQQNVSL